MAYSSILGADPAPSQPSGRSSDLLGPSDSSDTGSDAVGTREDHADSDVGGTGERGSVYGPDASGEEDLGEAVDDGPGSGNGFPEADPDAQEYTDLDADSDGEADGEADR